MDDELKARIDKELRMMAMERMLREHLQLPLTSKAPATEKVAQKMPEKSNVSTTFENTVTTVSEEDRDQWIMDAKDYLLHDHQEEDFIYRTSGDSMVFAHLDESSSCLHVYDMEIRRTETLDLSPHFFKRRKSK